MAPKSILIADDNDDLRLMLAHQLHARGYRIVMASDGRQAVDKSISEKPDLILLDIMMPGKDGTQASQEIRSNPLTSRIPILFLTSMVGSAEGDLIEDSHGNQTLPKSIAVDDLVRKIEAVLSGSR